MFFLNEGMPEENEIVLCRVTKVLPNSVFANLEEYRHKSGMLHISEVSPGRIRNIRDYVKESKVIICKVLRIDLDKGHIDLTLRRVSESQRRNKIDSLKKEQIAEKMLEQIAKKYKVDPKVYYLKITKKVFEEYDSLYDAFEDFIENKIDLAKLGIDHVKDFEELIQQRIKLPEYAFEGDLLLKSREPDGVEIIRNALTEADKVVGEHDIRYKGAGKYLVTVNSQDPKESERIMKEISDIAVSYMEKHKSEGSFTKLG